MGDLLPHSTTASATMEGIAYTPEATQGYILCADCGTPIPPNSANRCVNCLKNSVDAGFVWTEGGLLVHRASASLRDRVHRHLHPVPRLHASRCQEHLARHRPGPPEG